jgi:hypothetical protein
MKRIRTDYAEPKGGRVSQAGWERILGRHDLIADEINRMLGRSITIEETPGGIWIARSQKDA